VPKLSLDAWATLLAFALAGAVYLRLFPAVAW
jgi:hypothetical protein